MGAARCLRHSPDELFVRGAAQQQAKMVCQRCPVIAECLAEALDNRTEFGVWGGMTEAGTPGALAAQARRGVVVGLVRISRCGTADVAAS